MKTANEFGKIVVQIDDADVRSERETFHLVHDWHKQNRTCCVCGGKRSVKYDFNDRHYCNLCILWM